MQDLRSSKEGKLIYIMGAGRSGTTLLDIVLGNSEEIFNCGELNNYTWRNGYPQYSDPENPKYKFWMRIRSLITQKHDLQSMHAIYRKYDFHTGLIKRLLGLIDIRKKTHYINFLGDLYRNIYSTIPQTIISDSSKYPGRALTLSKIFGRNMMVLYIKRDPVAVSKSFQKKNIEQNSKGYLQSIVYYFIINLLCTVVYNKLTKKHICETVTYESFIQDPSRTLKRLESKLNLKFGNVIQMIDNNQELQVGYLFDGNRIRLKETIKLKKEFPKQEANFTNAITRLINKPFYSE